MLKKITFSCILPCLDFELEEYSKFLLSEPISSFWDCFKLFLRVINFVLTSLITTALFRYSTSNKCLGINNCHQIRLFFVPISPPSSYIHYNLQKVRQSPPPLLPCSHIAYTNITGEIIYTWAKDLFP